MASGVRITMRSSAVDGGTVYDWVVDDAATGHILVREDTGVICPCSENGQPLGSMSARRASGSVANPDPATRKNFTVIAAAFFREWDRSARLPEVVMGTYW